MRNRLVLLVGVACLLSAGIAPARADVVLTSVGDSQTIRLDACVSGDPGVFPDRAQRISVTAGSYRFYLENSYWNFGVFGSFNEVVGGVILRTADGSFSVSEPMAYGTNPNATVRTLYFDVPQNEVLLAGVCDNYLLDNGGLAIFTLTKTAEAVPLPAALPAGLAAMAGLAGFRAWRRSR